jgi:hypothetical protein
MPHFDVRVRRDVRVWAARPDREETKLFNLLLRDVRHPSQSSYVVCDDITPVALFLSKVVGKFRSTWKYKKIEGDRWHTYW